MANLTVKEFQNEYRFLSNFWPCRVMYDGRTYTSTEAAYQAAKSTDPGFRDRMQRVRTPGEAKRAGKSVALRPDWLEVRRGIMVELVERKFQDPGLRKQLLDTGDAELVEGNTWHDKYWGKCNCPRCGGKGENNLGIILMELRKKLQEGK